jgi:hypothetical protein
MVVVLIGALTTLMLGIDETSWAVQAPDAQQAAQHEAVVRRLASLRRGATVEIERSDRTKFYAVVEEIGSNWVRVLRDEAKHTMTEVIPADSIREIREVTPQKAVSHGHKKLIIAAVVAGVLYVGLVSACRSASGVVKSDVPAPKASPAGA